MPLSSALVPAACLAISADPAAPASDRFFFATDLGVSLLPRLRIRDVPATAVTAGVSGAEVSTDPGIAWTAALGVKLNERFGIEMQSGYLYNGLGNVAEGRLVVPTGSLALAGGDGWIQQIPVLFNGTYDLTLVTKDSGIGELKLQLGAGLGPVFVEGKLGGVTTAVPSPISLETEGSDWALGFQGTVAVRWSISPDMDLGFRYRFMGTTEASIGRVGASDIAIEAVYTNAIMGSFEIRF